jgi:hypothetical protein
LDEWQRRLDYLNRRQAGAAPFANERARVLAFLIQRYRDSPEAQRPAPAKPKADLQINQRAIVVLHHIWQGRVGGIKSPQEAQARVSAILKRISSPPSTDERKTAEPDVLAPDSPDADAASAPPVASNNAEQAVSAARIGDARIAAASPRGPILPQWMVLELYQRIVSPESDDVQAVESLTRGRNRAALNYALYAWRELVQAGRTNQACRMLHRFLATPEPTGVVIEGVRESLAHDNVRVRFAALDILARIGTLEDIGLVDDLLALPSASDEHPSERPALLRTMRAIAEATR